MVLVKIIVVTIERVVENSLDLEPEFRGHVLYASKGTVVDSRPISPLGNVGPSLLVSVSQPRRSGQSIRKPRVPVNRDAPNEKPRECVLSGRSIPTRLVGRRAPDPNTALRLPRASASAHLLFSAQPFYSR